MLQRKPLTVAIVISILGCASWAYAQSSGGSQPAPQPGGDTSTTTQAPQQPGQGTTQTDPSGSGSQQPSQDPKQSGQDSSQQPH